jgi:hypothetical protein
LLRAIAGNAIRPVALPEKFSCLGVKTLSHRLEILGRNFPFEAKQLGTASVPLAFNGAILVVVIALLKVTLCIALAAGHSSNRQHSQTLALFEISDQAGPLPRFARAYFLAVLFENSEQR